MYEEKWNKKFTAWLNYGVYMAQLISFHNKQSVKDKYVSRVLAHQKADRIIKGIGWNGHKGCAVGCTLENYEHSRYPIELGLPVWLANLEDGIFEGLPEKQALFWPAKFLLAIPIGIKEKQFDKLYHQLAILRQERNLKLQMKLFTNKTAYRDQVIAAIRLTIEYHKNPARSAAKSARSAAASAAASARSAESAAESAVSAAVSARSAESAELAAWSAVSAAALAESAELAAWSAAVSAARSAVSAAVSAAESAESAELAAWSAVSAARSAAWSAVSAARSAAWSAAWSASRSAAYKQEAKDLLKLLKALDNKAK